jgi:hypothetical protein
LSKINYYVPEKCGPAKIRIIGDCIGITYTNPLLVSYDTDARMWLIRPTKDRYVYYPQSAVLELSIELTKEVKDIGLQDA